MTSAEDTVLKTDRNEVNSNITTQNNENVSSQYNSDNEKNLAGADKNSISETPKYFNGVEISNLTKTQMKKYQKMLKWEARKKEKRLKERLKAKKRKLEAKQNNVDLGPSRKQLKRSTMANSTCKISVVIDLSFDHLMINKASSSCVNLF